MKPFFAPTKCSTSITDLLVAIAPRVAKVTDNMVAMNIKIRIPMLAPTAVPAIVRMRSIQPRWSSRTAPGAWSLRTRLNCAKSGAAPGAILSTIRRGTGNSSRESPLPSQGSSNLFGLLL